MRQCEPQRIPGLFYLPEAPDRIVPGILTWEPTEGATLELIGGFSTAPDYQPNPNGGGVYATQVVGDVRSGTVFGESASGQKLSVWGARRGNYTVVGTMSKVRKEFWSSSWVCVGAHITSPRDAAFSMATLELDGLYYLTSDGRFCPPRWATIEGVERPGELLADGTRLMPYVLPVVGGYKAACASAETDDAKYSVDTRATQPWISDATEALPSLKLDMMKRDLRRGQVIELHVGASVSIRLPSDSAGSAEDFVDRITPILDLMRLATFDSSGVESIALEAVGNQGVSLLSRVGEPARPDDVYQPTSAVFNFEDVSLDSFLSARSVLIGGREAAYAWSVVIGHCGYVPKFVEQYLSQVLAAAEGFHTWCLRNEAKEDLNLRLKSLLETLPDRAKARLNLEADNWATWAVWARHYVAHGGIKRSQFLDDNLQMLAIAKSVNLVTYLAVLSELGVPEEKIVEALMNHPRLSALVPYCNEVNQIRSAPTS